MSSIEHIKSRLPDFAKDQRINLGIIAQSTELSPAQAWGSALASAAASRNAELLQAIDAEATAHLGPEAKQAALAAASIMGMNNVYYRFMHFMEGVGTYASMPAKLRMQVIGKPGVEHLDFELWCLAVSAINGCESCVRSHANVVNEKGGSAGAVQDAVRIASVIHATAVSLDAAAALRATTSPAVG